MNRPLVSVVMPAYNSELYIGKSIESVLSQEYSYFELLVVDDGSKDDTLKCLNQYALADKRIKVFSQTNQGVSVARNIGLDNAKGEYIAFLDSDDLWDRNYLQVMVKEAIAQQSSFIYCGTDIINIDGSISYKDNNYGKGNLFNFVTNNNEIRLPFLTCGILIKKSILDDNNIRFDAGIEIMEDIGFYLKLFMVTEVSCVQKSMSYYSKHPNSATTSSFNPQKWRGSVEIFRYAEPFVRKYKSEWINRYYKMWDYYAYRFVWSTIKRGMYNCAIKLVDDYAGNLERFTKNGTKINDRIKCSLLLRRKKFILKILTGGKKEIV